MVIEVLLAKYMSDTKPLAETPATISLVLLAKGTSLQGSSLSVTPVVQLEVTDVSFLLLVGVLLTDFANEAAGDVRKELDEEVLRDIE